MRYAIVESSVVTNVIEAESADFMPGDDPNTYDKTFRGAFKHVGGVKIDVDLSKAKLITHEKRREKRAQELAPLDVQATIPNQSAAAETARQKIRDDYATIQANIDASPNVNALRSIVLALQAR